MAQQLTFITCRKIGIHKYPDEYQIALNKNHKTKARLFHLSLDKGT